MRFLLLPVLVLLSAAAADARVPVQGYVLQASYPHDPAAFTQGLFFRDGHLYESTGIKGRSSVRKVRLKDGALLQGVALPANLFGEGITHWGNEIVGVTWRDQVGYRLDFDSLKPNGAFTYSGEGWGLTQDGTHIILSDGTSWLRFLDPATMKEVRRVQVLADGAPVAALNELEWVKGEVYANVWQTNRIARIDAMTGEVKGWIDLTGLDRLAKRGGPDEVLNGIAYDAEGDRLFVTGKHWPKLFEIKLTAPRSDP